MENMRIDVREQRAKLAHSRASSQLMGGSNVQDVRVKTSPIQLW